MPRRRDFHWSESKAVCSNNGIIEFDGLPLKKYLILRSGASLFPSEKKLKQVLGGQSFQLCNIHKMNSF